MEAVRELEEHGYPPAFAPFLTVRRRQAHCLQRALEHARARRCLENLLELESDPNHQAMVHADLGLLASRFNSLDEVSLPFGRHELPDLVDRLREGVEHFQRSVAKDVEYAAHGHYCLGVLALAEHTLAPSKDKYGVAEDHFLRARSRFGARRKSYGKVLVEQTNLYFGISKAAQAESAGELAHAARIMMSALEGGAAFPPYLIDPVVAGLEVGSATDELASFATALLATGDDDALDALAKSTAVVQECGEVSDALRQRAHRLGKSELAAADLRSCLVGYLRAGRYREAEEVLDQLEALAVQGVGVAEFEELLATKAGYQPAWEPEEATIARARCLEARNQLEDALVLLQPLVHQYATEGDLHDAGGVLDRLRGYGLPTEYLALEENRVNALAEQDRTHLDAVASSAPKRQGKPVRVLFVGGDERQAKSENAVRQQVRDRAPHVQLKFIYPGWSGNWSHHLERVNAELKRHDALVMMRFMRTELGKQIRKRCDKPWRFCWGAGRKQMSDAIIAAAQAGAAPD